MTNDNIIHPREFSRKEIFIFQDGKVTIEVNEGEPPLTVKTAVYFVSNILYQIHRMMEPDNER